MAREKQPTFKVTEENGNTSEITKHFDMLHVTPPQCAPDFIALSPLANEKGWIDVDKFTLQHIRYKNIFGFGDAPAHPMEKQEQPSGNRHLLLLRIYCP